MMLLLHMMLGASSATSPASEAGAWRPEASDGTQCLGSADTYGHSPTCLPRCEGASRLSVAVAAPPSPPPRLRQPRCRSVGGCREPDLA
jgi:hypothetical protein